VSAGAINPAVSAAVASGDRGSLSAHDLVRLLAGPGGSPAWQWFGGHAFGVVGDLEPLRELFEVEGCTVAVARPRDDGGFDIAARQVTLFRDPVSRQVLERWRNPWTGKELPVAHERRDGLRVRLPAADALAPWLGTGSRAAVFLDNHGVTHFPLVPAAAPAGAERRATSSAQLAARRADLADPGVAAVGYVGAWQLIADWPAWLGMGEQPGYLFQRAFVRKASGRDDLPAELARAIAVRFPGGIDPPGWE
jgi:hypothetical protein